MTDSRLKNKDIARRQRRRIKGIAVWKLLATKFDLRLGNAALYSGGLESSANVGFGDCEGSSGNVTGNSLINHWPHNHCELHKYNYMP